MAVAVNQAFDAPHVRSGAAGATIFVWHTRRL
jgi:hypothetical protein